MKTVVIVDDHLVLAESLALELARREIAEAIIVDPSGASAHDLTGIKADACLIDLDLGEHLSRGVVFLQAAVGAGLPAAMFTGSDDDVQLGRCLADGAVGIIPKSLHFAEVAERVRRLVHGEAVNSDTELLHWVLAAQNFRKSRARELAAFDQLTARERVVLQHIIDGRRASAIAEADHVSVATVRSQVRSVLQKLGVHSQIEAVAMARQVKWADPSLGTGD